MCQHYRSRDDTYAQRFDRLRSNRYSLGLHLTEITFNEYRGTTPEIKFATFFVEKARLFKVMRFALYLLCTSEWMAKERMRLQLNGKGYAQAEF